MGAAIGKATAKTARAHFMLLAGPDGLRGAGL